MVPEVESRVTVSCTRRFCRCMPRQSCPWKQLKAREFRGAHVCYWRLTHGRLSHGRLSHNPQDIIPYPTRGYATGSWLPGRCLEPPPRCELWVILGMLNTMRAFDLAQASLAITRVFAKKSSIVSYARLYLEIHAHALPKVQKRASMVDIPKPHTPICRSPCMIPIKYLIECGSHPPCHHMIRSHQTQTQE